MKKIRLLLVDDDQDFRKAAITALTRRGFEILEAESGDRALEILGSSCPEAIVLDLKMAGKSGIETLGEIRETGSNTPVIILSGHGNIEDAVAGVQLGIVDFLKKPVDMDRLADRIRHLLSRDLLEPLREKKIGDIAISTDLYPKIYVHQTIRELVLLLHNSAFGDAQGPVTEQGHRTVLVFDEDDSFVGCLRIVDVLRAFIPKGLIDGPYSTYLTGMFAGQCKILDAHKIEEIVDEPVYVDAEAPLMEAVHLMAKNSVINLSVLEKGKLVGMLRDKDLLAEAARYLL